MGSSDLSCLPIFFVSGALCVYTCAVEITMAAVHVHAHA